MSTSWKASPVLEGHGVRVRPATLQDAEALFSVCPEDCFQHYVTIQPREWSVEGFRNYVRTRLDAPNTQTFVIESLDGQVIGESAYMDMREPWRCLEIGMTWITPSARGTHVNPAIKLLMLEYAFETLKCVRVTLKTDGRNVRSQNAIAKLGAQREGTLRKFGIQPNGFVRDTVYFSILEDEWPAVLAGLQRRLI